MLIRVGFSADPDDAFMFWGLASGTVSTRGHDFEPVIEDIQTLNHWALDGKLEVTAMSLATLPRVADRDLLSLEELQQTEILVPGELTTAYMVLRMVLGGDFPHREARFDEIMPAV